MESFFFQKSVSQNKIKNNRGDIIFMIQAPLSFLCYVDERNRFDVSLQFCLVFRLFYLPFSYKNYVTLHWLQKCTVSGSQLLKDLCFFTKLYLFIVFFTYWVHFFTMFYLDDICFCIYTFLKIFFVPHVPLIYLEKK